MTKTNKQIKKLDNKIKRTERKIRRRVPLFLYEVFEEHYDNKKKALRQKVQEYQREKAILQDSELNEELKRGR